MRERFTDETLTEGAKAHFWFDTGGGKGNGPEPIDCTVVRVTRCYVNLAYHHRTERISRERALHSLRAGWVAS